LSPKPKLQKHTKQEFCVQQGGLGAFIAEKSTTSFFVSTMAKTAPAGRFRTSFVDRNQNFENALDMSFGSNGEDWVQSFRKKSTASFFA
jgi:hypothetical protein